MVKTGEPRVGVMEGQRAILHAAEELFAGKGFRGVSIDEIATAAGVSKGLVHYHFNTKDELFCHLIRVVRERLSDEVERALGAGATAREKLRALVRAYLSLTRSQRSLWRIAMNEANTLGGQVKELLGECRQANLARIARVLEEGIAAGEVKRVNPALASLCLMGIISEAVLSPPASGRGMDVEELTDHITELFFQGVAG